MVIRFLMLSSLSGLLFIKWLSLKLAISPQGLLLEYWPLGIILAMLFILALVATTFWKTG